MAIEKGWGETFIIFYFENLSFSEHNELFHKHYIEQVGYFCRFFQQHIPSFQAINSFWLLHRFDMVENVENIEKNSNKSK